jgi:hypothetical protein
MMIDGRIVPPAYVGSCSYCADPLDTRSTNNHVRVSAWIPCGSTSTSHGGNTVTMVDRSSTYVCRTCYDRLKAGIPPAQMSIFDV